MVIRSGKAVPFPMCNNFRIRPEKYCHLGYPNRCDLRPPGIVATDQESYVVAVSFCEAVTLQKKSQRNPERADPAGDRSVSFLARFVVTRGWYSREFHEKYAK